MPYFSLEICYNFFNIRKGLLSGEQVIDVIYWIKICPIQWVLARKNLWKLLMLYNLVIRITSLIIYLQP